ncbi:endocuticle structural glycoprotein ABD-4 [Eurytemora carolleeae]|uniref:endocuticle structural glycoprotein ABD-4 n=1 Tax=Eurytemora carolleeae TaxID=1294199 RepID=UPI000C77F36E|nr:endocuticle structural glycoprotein ABD-4 [Eurytemora carolleeae]|eukprot:XP_023327399.1 endocuticle structural glycoprotein ABD-4-like [Eurytemora affinis]
MRNRTISNRTIVNRTIVNRTKVNRKRENRDMRKRKSGKIPLNISNLFQADYGGLDSAASQVVDTRIIAEPVAPIAIVRSSFDGPLPAFRYSYETENEIQQSAEGEMKVIDDSEVMVMRGSYSYVGPDGQTYQVDWYADETGFHPTAAHLPKSVEPDHPEVAAAVRAQLEFAAQEDAAAAASNIVEDRLAGYGSF